jgi:GH25 family lysozyme M1 (1,4-beta-N-acetylmuramidase)
MKRINQLGLLSGIFAAMVLSAASVHANNLFGIDVSSYQGNINWATVHADGAVFAFARATEGTTFTDVDFAGNMSRGKAAGMQMGAYHFAHPDADCPSSEVNHFWNVAGPYILADGKSLSPALDLEVFNGIACGLGSYTAWANKFNSLVKAKTSASLNCQIITSPCAACNLNGNITLGPWIVNYNGENLYTGSPWNVCCKCGSSIWNYWGVTGTGAIGGISGNVDFDAYNGSLTQLKAQQGIGGI